MEYNFLTKVNIKINESVKDYSAQYTAFGIFGVFNYPIYYLIWLYLSPQTYENFWLRITATLLCACLALNAYWPIKLKKYLPIFWYFTLFFCLPFFFTFMLIKNHGTGMWVANTILIIFFLMFLVDWLSCLVLLLLGGLFGIVFAYLSSSKIWFIDNFDYVGFFITYTVSVIIGALFSRNKQMLEKHKLQVVESIGAYVVHELRTPLRAINLSAEGLKKYLSDLFYTYNLAKDHQLEVPYIRPSQFKLLETTCDDIASETNYSNIIINMLLINSEQLELKPSDFQSVSILHCVEEVLRRYPFQSGENELIEFNRDIDFNFVGKEILTVHVLFNLLKNAIYYIRAAQKGKINIWAVQGERYNELHFLDTGKGISKEILPKIFDLFFSKTYHGSGIGLAFCKMVMQSYGGSIECKSIEGEYTEFILNFPK